jgi:four helix bundle protein
MSEDKNVFNFEKLLVYQKSLNFIDEVYEIIEKFPANEKFNITDQFRRAATSIALNIGEGSGGTDKEFNAFLRISKRSIKECIVCVTIAHRRKYITENEEFELRKKLVELSKMNSGLIKSIKSKLLLKEGAKTPYPKLSTPN